MPTKIRLQRHGKKGQPFYHIVIADGRAPRDGRFIEKIGIYNPLVTPAQIDLDFDRAYYWYRTGAVPTDTVRAILKYKGILLKDHLERGVKKGALTEEQAQAKFEAWLNEKQSKIASKANSVKLKEKEELKKRQAAEVKVNEERAAAIAKKNLAKIDPEAVAAIETQTENAEEPQTDVQNEQPDAE